MYVISSYLYLCPPATSECSEQSSICVCGLSLINTNLNYIWLTYQRVFFRFLLLCFLYTTCTDLHTYLCMCLCIHYILVVLPPHKFVFTKCSTIYIHIHVCLTGSLSALYCRYYNLNGGCKLLDLYCRSSVGISFIWEHIELTARWFCLHVLYTFTICKRRSLWLLFVIWQTKSFFNLSCRSVNL